MGFEFLEEDKDIKGKSKAKKQHTRNGIQLLLLFFFFCLFVCLFVWQYWGCHSALWILFLIEIIHYISIKSEGRIKLF
jgi:hypothetical protein